MRGGRPRSRQEGSGTTPPGESSRPRHSGSIGSFRRVGSLVTQSGSHSDEWDDADASHLPQGILNVSWRKFAPHVGPKAASFGVPLLLVLVKALTFALASLAMSSNLEIGVVSGR